MNNITPDKALIWLDFKNQVGVGGLQSINNYGKTSISPAYVTCGNGTTSTTYPTQLSGQKGVSFDSGDYIQFSIDNTNKKIGNNFTVMSIACVNQKTTTDWLVFSLFGQINSSNPNSVAFGIRHSTGNFSLLQEAVAWDASAATPQNRNINSYCMTVQGNSAIGYLNSKVISNLTLSGTYANGNLCLLNGSMYGSGVGTNITANQYAFVLFPYVLSSLEIKYLHNLLMRSIKV